MTANEQPGSGKTRRGSGSAERDLIYRFAGCVVDSRSLTVLVGGELVKLEPKPLDLLLFLLRHAGEVVTKDELQEGVWPGRMLSDSVLTKTIARLRQTLGDEDLQMIRTVHGYGYRLVAPVAIETAVPVPGAAPVSEGPTRQAGDLLPLRPNWRLLERLGAGGMGEAWLAEQVKSGERRVFKFALDAAGLNALKREITLYRVLRGIYGERPDFVRVVDWNLDEAPYFIESEHAAGGSLPQWAQARGGLPALPLTERLELVAQAAEALAAAHAAGVLHKDLKPSNLLIQLDDGDPARPRVQLGDFGSGRMLDLARLEQLEITRLGFTRVTAMAADPAGSEGSGTPFYFAPELLAGQQPTAQTDIYALGVLLFQIIVADFKRPLTAGWEREVDDPLLREDVAAAAAGSVAERLTDAAELARRLRRLPERRRERELRQRQLDEAAALRESLARSQTRRRLLRAVAASLALGLALSLWQFRQAQQAGIKAQASAQEAEAVASFVTQDLLNLADPMLNASPQLTVRALLLEARQRLDRRPSIPPLARARILDAIGKAHEGLGDWSTAREIFASALKETEAAAGPKAEASLRLSASLAYALVLRGDFNASEALYRRVLADSATLGPDHELVLDARDGLTFVAYERGDFLDAAQRFEQLRADLERFGKRDRLTDVNWMLPDLYLELGRTDEAEQAIQRALADTVRAMGSDHPRVHWMRLTYGDVLMQRRRWDEADAIYLASLAALRASLGEDHPHTLTALHYHGHLLLRRGDPAAAVPVLKAAHAGRLRAHGKDHPYPRFSAHRLAQAWMALEQVDLAIPMLEETLAAAEAAQGASHPNVFDIRCSLAEAWLIAGQPDRARPLIDAVLPLAQNAQLAGTERRVRVEQVWARAHAGEPAALRVAVEP